MHLNIFFAQLTILIPELWSFITILFLFVNALVLSSKCLKDKKQINFVLINSILYNLINIILFFEFVLLLIRLSWNVHLFTLNFMYEITVFSDSISILLTLIMYLYFGIARNYWSKEQVYSYEWLILIFISYLGMHLILHSIDFLMLYIAIEMQSLPLYILAAYNRFSFKSTEAALKYFILGALTSGLLLFGISIIYGVFGSLNFYEINLIMECLFTKSIFIEKINTIYLSLISIGFIFILIALFFKLGIAPFSNWVSDVYHGVFSGVTAFFAIVPKLSLVFILVKIFFFNFIGILEIFPNLFLYSGLLSIGVGTFGALYQINLKRLLAYGTINHMGFVLLNLGLNDYSSTLSSFLYLLLYLLISINFFSLYLNLKYNKFFDFEELATWIPLYKFQPIISIPLILCLFSMAGIPPLSGFFGKFFIILNALNHFEIFVCIFLVCLSVIAAVYYVRLITLIKFFQIKQPIIITITNSMALYIYSATFFIQLTCIFWLPFLIKMLEFILF